MTNLDRVTPTIGLKVFMQIVMNISYLSWSQLLQDGCTKGQCLSVHSQKDLDGLGRLYLVGSRIWILILSIMLLVKPCISWSLNLCTLGIGIPQDGLECILNHVYIGFSLGFPSLDWVGLLWADKYICRVYNSNQSLGSHKDQM